MGNKRVSLGVGKLKNQASLKCLDCGKVIAHFNQALISDFDLTGKCWHCIEKESNSSKHIPAKKGRSRS